MALPPFLFVGDQQQSGTDSGAHKLQDSQDQPGAGTGIRQRETLGVDYLQTKIMKAIALCLALVLCFGSAIAVSAAEVADAPIDESQKGSLTIFKYDLTGSENAGIWDSSYVSTGVADESGVNETMKNYALEGVEFSFVKVADIVQFTESTADNRTDNHVEVLYAIDKVQGADFLKALGLENGANCYQNADQMDSSKYFYQSDVLIHALSAALTANSTVVKNAMEQYIAAIGGTAMPLTDSFGKTKAENLTLGLYLIVETKVPENVVSTTDSFLISLPMTSVNGTNATDGGTRWIYDVTVYPKNQTGDPTLEKTLRESKSNTGKNNGTTGITDGFAHTSTASGGDTVEYQIISTLPAITSESTYLTTYTFVDTLSKGVTYAKADVVLEFFTDSTCTDSVAKWTEADGKFTASYNTVDAGETMTISMTQTGLAEINTSKTVYSAAGMVNSGYSDLTLRITYAAKLDSDNSVAYGDDGNPNDVQPSEQRLYPELWEAMTSYNEAIFAQGQSGLSCKLDYQQPSFRLADYGLKEEVFGFLTIPAMELEMPIYLGATDQHMADGAAHLSQTSLPIGGNNTNCVIAGHRGYGGASYFRYIDQLQIGDTVTVTNLWEQLTYRVAEIKIIYPYEVDQILIQPGREQLTLLTCHPYASGGKQRYLVICERVYQEDKPLWLPVPCSAGKPLPPIPRTMTIRVSPFAPKQKTVTNADSREVSRWHQNMNGSRICTCRPQAKWQRRKAGPGF